MRPLQELVLEMAAVRERLKDARDARDMDALQRGLDEMLEVLHKLVAAL